jgi:hypothetical protein
MRAYRWIKTLLAAMLPVCILAATSCDSTAPEQTGLNGSQSMSTAAQIVGLNCNPSFDRRTAEEKRVHERILQQTGGDAVLGRAAGFRRIVDNRSGAGI